MRALRWIQTVFSLAALSSMGACQLLTGTSDLKFDGKTGGGPDCETCYSTATHVIGVADSDKVEWCSGKDGIDRKRYDGLVTCMQIHPLCKAACNGFEPTYEFPLGETCNGYLKTNCSDKMVACLLQGGCINCGIAFELNLGRNEQAQWCEGSQEIYQDFVDNCRCETYTAPPSGGCKEKCTGLSACGDGEPSGACSDCFLAVACADACVKDPLP